MSTTASCISSKEKHALISRSERMATRALARTGRGCPDGPRMHRHNHAGGGSTRGLWRFCLNLSTVSSGHAAHLSAAAIAWSHLTCFALGAVAQWAIETRKSLSADPSSAVEFIKQSRASCCQDVSGGISTRAGALHPRSIAAARCANRGPRSAMCAPGHRRWRPPRRLDRCRVTEPVA